MPVLSLLNDSVDIYTMQQVKITGLRGKLLYEQEVPSTWDELKPWQYQQICFHLCSHANTATIKLQCLMVLLQQSGQPDSLKTLEKLTGEQVNALIPLTNFIWDSDTITKNLMPVISLGPNTWIGVGAKLENMTLLEFVFADLEHRKYLKGNKQAIDKLIAILYRPQMEGMTIDSPAYMGDLRQPLNIYNYELRAEQLAPLPWYIKYAVLTNYAALRANLAKRFKNVFTIKTDAKTTTQSLLNMMIDLSGDKFGTFNETQYTNIDVVFTHIDMQLQQAEKLKESLPKKQR
jgi:hypothetical protein